MTSSTLDDLVDAYCRVSRGNAVALDQYHALAALFERARIPFVVLKGLAVLLQLYGIRGTRPLSDVDLLVHATDLATIDAILTGAGYVRQIDGNPCYASPESGLSFDLVTTLWYLDEQGLAELWANARSYDLPPRSVLLLAADDLLIHLTAYAVIHRGALTPAWEQDLRLLLLRESIDWAAVTRKARQYSLSVPLLHGLTYLRHRIPTLPIPESVLQALTPADFFEKRLYWALQRLVTAHPIPELGHGLIWLTRPAGGRWSSFRQTLFPTESFLEYRYGNAAARRPVLTRCRRTIALTGAALVLAVRIARRLIRGPQENPA